MFIPAYAQRFLGSWLGAVLLLLSSISWGSSPAMVTVDASPSQTPGIEPLDLIQDRPGALRQTWTTSIAALGWLWEGLYDNTIHWLTPPSPTTLTNRVSKKDAAQLFQLLGEAGYTLTEIDSQVGIIPTIGFKFGQVRELSETDYEYLESMVSEWHKRNPGLYSNLQRSIIDTVIAVNLSTEYHVSSLEIQLLPLPEVAFTVSPKVTALSEENSALMRAIQRLDRSSRGLQRLPPIKASFTLAPIPPASPAATMTPGRSASSEPMTPNARLPVVATPKPTSPIEDPPPTATAVPPPTQAIQPATGPPSSADSGAGPTKVKGGMYITQLYDLDLPKKSFNIAFWAWFLHNNETYKLTDSVEIANSKSSSLRYPFSTNNAGLQWEQGKYYATVAQDWDIKNYPFDKQKLQVYLEDGQNDINSLVFEADTKNSRIDQSVSLIGWTIESFELTPTPAVYATTYGDPNLDAQNPSAGGQSIYSRLVATITIKRNGTSVLPSMFIGFFVAFILSSLSYFMIIDTLTTPRFSMNTGALFASIGNKIAADRLITESSSLTLIDTIEITTFIVILIALAMSITWRLTKDKHPRFAKRSNIVVGIISFCSYIVYNSFQIIQAATS